VDAVAEAVEGLANPKAKAAGAPRQTVELFIELGDFAGLGGGDFAGRWGRNFGARSPHIPSVYSLNTEHL
jgi:hypothetical protein